MAKRIETKTFEHCELPLTSSFIFGAAAMWHLKMAGKGQRSVTIGNFETIAAAARKIIELEASKSYGVFFEIYIETGIGAISEEESLGHLEHTGKSGRCYVVKRIKH